MDIASIRQDLNNPPTPVGGISSIYNALACRLDLNYPPTAVGGIHVFSVLRVIRRIVGSSVLRRTRCHITFS